MSSVFNGKIRLIDLSDDNFEIWEARLRAVFYAMGLGEFYIASTFARGDDEEIDDAGEYRFPTGSAALKALRGQAFGMVYCSIPPTSCLNFNDVPHLEVEELIRRIRATFFTDDEETRALVKKEIFNAKLEDHVDLMAYIAFHVTKRQRLATLGYNLLDARTRICILCKACQATTTPYFRT